MIRIEAPSNTTLMKSGLQLRHHATMTHTLHRLTLMSFGNIRSDKRKWYSVQLIRKHHIHVVYQFPRNAVLVSGHPDTQIRHRPIDARPMQSRETRADTQCAFPEIASRARKNSARGVDLLYSILDRNQVLQARRKIVELANLQSIRKSRF